MAPRAAPARAAGEPVAGWSDDDDAGVAPEPRGGDAARGAGVARGVWPDRVDPTWRVGAAFVVGWAVFRPAFAAVAVALPGRALSPAAGADPMGWGAAARLSSPGEAAPVVGNGLVMRWSPAWHLTLRRCHSRVRSRLRQHSCCAKLALLRLP
jgi:hypothetical protein